MRKRLQKQRKLAKKMIEGLYEIDYAQKRYERLQMKSNEMKKQIMDNKLKMKGYELLKEWSQRDYARILYLCRCQQKVQSRE